MPSEPSTVGGNKSVEELRCELAEARRREGATAEILRVISRSPTDLQSVLDTVAKSAAHLCEAEAAGIFRRAENRVLLVAHYGPMPLGFGPVGEFSFPLTRGSVNGRSVLDARTIHVADLTSESSEYPEGSENARRYGHRTVLAVPLLREGVAMGSISLHRVEAQLFNETQIALLQTFADQAVIAIENARLFEAEQARTREVTERTRELTEALEQQTATADVLKVISRSALDLQRVLDALVESAARLCEANDALIYQVVGDGLRLVAHHGQIPLARPVGQLTLPLVRGLIAARAVLDRRTIHIADMLAEADEYPEGRKYALQSGYRTALAVPLVHAGKAVGVILIRRAEVRPFTERQIELVNTFADQAVIAIENTRLFEAEQTSKRELRESLEYQTATSDVLDIISRSKFELQPVFNAIVESGLKLFPGAAVLITLPDGNTVRAAAVAETDPARAEAVRRQFPIPLTRAYMHGIAILDRRVVDIPDGTNVPDELATGGHAFLASGNRAITIVPMMRGDDAIGALSVLRLAPGPLSSQQLELLQTFADQAVIAIENTRLFEEVQARTKELQDSLDRQTATSEVLGVISRSPNEVQPVLDTIVATAQRLCQAERAIIWRLEGETFRVVAHHGVPEELVESVYSARMPVSRGSMAGRATLARRAVQVEDYTTDAELVAAARAFHRAANAHTVLAVPLLLKGHPIGVIGLARTRVAPFDDKQVALVEAFADQAVIAIENSRLFEAEQASKRELTEALEQQTATADVLKVISRSALDVQKVLDALVESAARLCNANDAAILQVIGDSLRLVARHGGQIPFPGPVGQYMIPLERGSIGPSAVIDRRTIHVADVATADEYPASRTRALQLGVGTALAVPLIHAGKAIGVIFIRRGEVRPFTERQIELVNTFADQAVIAIENTRLFDEVQARTRELAKTVEDLEIASQHKNQFVANMSHELRTPLAAILGYAELIQEGFYEPQGPKSLDALTRIRSNGKHLLGLINTVLDIAKIESGQFTLNMGEYAIESVVETVRSATESLAQNKKLTLKTEVAKSLPVGLGDEQRLTQVLLNLVGNAIKFTDAGEVRVTAKAVNGRFAVSVADTGPGIPAEHQTRIFDQFHQVDSSNTKAKGGTGLGLAIAKQIVEMHGGRIWVESTLGKGSTFQMELPTRAEIRKLAP
jgi:signal transduction histidine kinase